MPSFFYIYVIKQTHTILKHQANFLAYENKLFSTSSVITNKPKNEIARMEENEYFANLEGKLRKLE